MRKIAPPSLLYPGLFQDLHASGFWPDGKQISDAIPLASPKEILTAYAHKKDEKGFDIRLFFETYFLPNPSRTTTFKSDLSQSIEKHIEKLWSVLTREKDQVVTGSSLIPLPHPYIVPGGRFNEIYYWDSYFTQLGLVQSGRTDAVADMVANFAFLIDTFGFIPNGNRSYFLGRSQPPFFSLMVQLLASQRGDTVLKQYRPQLEKEYAFWMLGQEDLKETKPTNKRVVTGPKGQIWNRYFDHYASPRDEMYQTDYEIAQNSQQDHKVLFGHLRAACESGWDFSSRWFANPQEIDSIYTTDIIPVDLNCLLFNLEDLLSVAFAKDKSEKSEFYAQKAKNRKKSIQTYFWNEATSFFHDLDRTSYQSTAAITLAGIFPLFFKLATPEQAQACALILEKSFLKPGGLITTLQTTSQQWDAPNGWAPLQWIAIKGLRNYGLHNLANMISERWMALNKKVYQQTGKMLEKYNVVNPDQSTGGGEYPVQDGFGWTNGVYLQLLGTH